MTVVVVILFVATTLGAWTLGVRRGRRFRKADEDFVYQLGVADGRRHPTTTQASERDRILVEAAQTEVAEAIYADNGG